VVELPYKIWNGQADTTIELSAGQSIQLESGYYQVQLDMTWNEMLTGFTFDIYGEDKQRTDTLFLQQARFYGPIVLHAPPEQFKHYCCEKLCDGKIEEVDSNGVIRFKGKFNKGTPTSNLKYFNQSGQLVKTEVYIDGQLERIK
jgi:antitoxin component YwqK of YwqJK toxin-antitoxin module